MQLNATSALTNRTAAPTVNRFARPNMTNQDVFTSNNQTNSTKFGLSPRRLAAGITTGIAAILLLLATSVKLPTAEGVRAQRDQERLTASAKKDSVALAGLIESKAFDPQHKAQQMVNRLVDWDVNEGSSTVKFYYFTSDELRSHETQLLFNQGGFATVAEELRRGGYDSKANAIQALAKAGKASLASGQPLQTEDYTDALHTATLAFNDVTEGSSD